MAMPSENRSVPELFTDLLGEVSVLFRQEMQLARTELSEKAERALTGLAVIAIGAVLLMAALVILLQAGVAALIEAGLEAHWAALIVAGVSAVIGFILVRSGLSSLKLARLAPSRTVEQLQRDAAVAKEQTR